MTPPPHSNPEKMRKKNIISFLTDTDFNLFFLGFLEKNPNKHAISISKVSEHHQ